jgi:wyosine [tRNA(Phe)-imidazoG37] synthetase (radical SAM superfamily)
MSAQQLYTQHGRSFLDNRFVYPVISRRSGGLSVGVNLNPDKVCNFDCIYCQVDRTTQAETRFVETDELLAELEAMLAWVKSGQLYEQPSLRDVPAHLRRLNDIAFSGDGEPTTYRNFDEIVAACGERKVRSGFPDVRLILLTNASRFHRPHVQRGLQHLATHHGEIWAKLDAGTEAFFRRVERTTIPFESILQNIAWAAGRWPIVIQSLFLRLDGQPPDAAELRAYCDRLLEVVRGGGSIQRVQIYTIARPPAESSVSPLSVPEVDAIVGLVRETTGLLAEPFYGPESPVR